MSFPQLIGKVKKQGIEYVMVRPGISVCLWYAQPAQVLAPAVADILKKYIEFIPAASLSTYLTAGGTWKAMTPKVLKSTLDEMRSIGAGEYAEFHLGQEPARNVGRFGAHFMRARSTTRTSLTRSTCSISSFPTISSRRHR